MEKLCSPYKFKDNYPQKAKGMSFFAFIFSVFIYISIFYIFKLSPSKLFNNTQFWFFISNTLIIIILVDYGAFSCYKDKQHDFNYQEYIIRRRTGAPIFSRQSYDPQIIIRTCIPAEEAQESIQEKRIMAHQRLIPEKKLTTFPEGRPRTETSTSTQTGFDGNINNVCDKNTITAKTFQRSQSEIIKRVVIDESKNIIRRVETEKYESPQNVENGDEEEDKNNEYANMSNEELNKRFEEFIQKFNSQIRLQRDSY
ncbi:hypothetical protein JCGZ_04635 [Jatropha curcas]|uniref:DUF4408 domain-containing protein n=1 Tax=Jatropha curcas TaxID=180498 RepID=A0A067KPC4_JATCU|nr:uncharacterized protein LOC105634262 [Jatropha curcas]KDP37992.1 hypothetical protein JCGZ_04635 [Jatropha curcas]